MLMSTKIKVYIVFFYVQIVIKTKRFALLIT